MSWFALPQINQLRSLIGNDQVEVWLMEATALDASAHQSARLSARQLLLEKWPDEFPNTVETLNLSLRPKSLTRFVSISHCPGLVAVAVADRPCGVDVEVQSRVKEKVARRVSLNGDYEIAPSAAHLWGAKESLFKSLPTNVQPMTISEIEVRDWQSLDKDTWKFSGHSHTTSSVGTGYEVGLGKDKLLALSFYDLVKAAK